jgi:hypothetical protein
VTSADRPLNKSAAIPLLVAAAGAVTSGYIHFYLYFEGGYRGIAPESVLGLTISRSFILTAIAGLVLAELLVAAVLWPRLTVPAALGGLTFGIGSFVAYLLARTAGLLGFTESTTSTEAVIALAAEAILIVTTSLILAHAWRASRGAAVAAVSGAA